MALRGARSARSPRRTRKRNTIAIVVIASIAARAALAANAANAAKITSVAPTAAETTEGGMATNDPNRPPWETPQWRSVSAPPPKQSGPSIGGVLGTLAIAVGVGVLGYYALDGHSHTCESCGNKWRHLGAFNVGDPGAHACSACGTVQWWKDGVPHVFRSALREPPRKVLPDRYVSKLQQADVGSHFALAASALGKVVPR